MGVTLEIHPDARDLLIPLLSHEAGTHVVLNCNLIIEEEKLLATVDELRGSVRYYSFEAPNQRRRLGAIHRINLAP